MITETTIYWITRLDGFNEFLKAAGVIFIILTFCGIVLTVHIFEKYETIIGVLIPVFTAILSVIFFIGVVLLPTTKEMIVIKGIPTILNSDFMQKTIPEESKELYVIAKKYLTEKMADENEKD